MDDKTQYLKKIFDYARGEKQWINSTLDSAYQYLSPSNTSNPEMSMARLYDNTANEELTKLAKKRYGQLFPVMQNWLGIVDKQGNDKINLTKKVNKAIRASNFHLEMPSAILDSLISTGAVMIRRGNEKHPIQFQSIHWKSLYFVENDNSQISDIFIKKKVMVSSLKNIYPDCSIPTEIEKQIKDNPAKKITLLECYCQSENGDKTELFVYTDNFSHKIFADTFNYNPIVVFRSDKIAGRAWGWGIGMTVLPNAKTVNRVNELTLQNASLVLSGMWQADDDGVLNVNSVKLKPGVIVPKAVGSAGLQRLPMAGEFNLSQIVINNITSNIKTSIHGERLPEKSDRSTATEWNIRATERRESEIPAAMRMITECFMPVCRAVVQILQDVTLSSSDYFIGTDDKSDENGVTDLEISPENPIARLESQMRAGEEFEYIIQLMGVFPEQMGQLIDVNKFLRNQMAANNVSADIIIPADEQQNQAAVLADELNTNIQNLENTSPEDLIGGGYGQQ